LHGHCTYTDGRFVQDGCDAVAKIASCFLADPNAEERAEIARVHKFIVPEGSKARFLQGSAAFGGGFRLRRNRWRERVIAVWTDEEALQKSKASAAEEFKKVGFKPVGIMKDLRVEMERAVS
jgi:hypothetical protein